jgi:hemerythrin-like domain-containing protein
MRLRWTAGVVAEFAPPPDRRYAQRDMFIRIGGTSDHDFDQPLGLLSDCHRRIEHFLDVIALITERASGRTLTAAETTDLNASLRYFATAAPRHTADEEVSLFPRLRACGGPAADVLDTIARLESEHDEVDRRHSAVHALLERWIADGALEAAGTAELRDHVRALQAIYRAHIAIEDTQLFPAAARLLKPEQLRVIGEEMAGRRGVNTGLRDRRDQPIGARSREPERS